MNDELMIPCEEIEYEEETLYEECILVEDETGITEIHRTITEDVTCYYSSYDELIDY